MPSVYPFICGCLCECAAAFIVWQTMRFAEVEFSGYIWGNIACQRDRFCLENPKFYWLSQFSTRVIRSSHFYFHVRETWLRYQNLACWNRRLKVMLRSKVGTELTKFMGGNCQPEKIITIVCNTKTDLAAIYKILLSLMLNIPICWWRLTEHSRAGWINIHLPCMKMIRGRLLRHDASQHGVCSWITTFECQAGMYSCQK